MDRTTNSKKRVAELDGTLTREERVLIARDVISRFKSRQRKFKFGSAYLSFRKYDGGSGEQFIPQKIKGTCMVCARGALFLASVDRFDNCKIDRFYLLEDEAIERSRREWGVQANLIEDAFEGFTNEMAPFRRKFLTKTNNRLPLLIGICENIIRNNGEFRPELEPGIEVAS